MTRRTERIGEQLRGELAQALLADVSDPRLRRVTVNRVDVAPDLTSALVFWSTVDDRDAAELEATEAGLDSAAGFLRGRLARRSGLKRMPELRFRYDPSLRLGSETLSLLRDLSDESTS